MRIRFSSRRAHQLVCAAAITALGAGCGGVECGVGTRNVDGRCEALTTLDPDAGIHCGEGTVLVGIECVADPNTLCGPFTSPVAELDDAGVPTGGFVCEGRGGGENPPPECPPAPPGGEICINGHARYLVDPAGSAFIDTLVTTSDATEALVHVYDPLAFAADPVNTLPLATGEVSFEEGTFIVTGVTVPAAQFIALVVEDVDDAVQDRFAFTGIPYNAAPGQNLELITAVAITQDQNASWSMAAGGDAGLAATGCPAPPNGDRTFLSCGTWIGVFAQGDQTAVGPPIEGVLPLNNASPIDPTRTFYFGIGGGQVIFDNQIWSDPGGPFEYTGTFGTVFFPGAILGQYAGQCEPGTPCENLGCTWDLAQLGGALPGALFVQYEFPVSCQ